MMNSVASNGNMLVAVGNPILTSSLSSAIRPAFSQNVQKGLILHRSNSSIIFQSPEISGAANILILDVRGRMLWSKKVSVGL